MKYYKIVSNGYIISIGTGNGGTEIAEEEYEEILSVIKNKPTPTEDTDYMLKEDLTWEAYAIEPIEPEPTAEELLDVLIGETND